MRAVVIGALFGLLALPGLAEEIDRSPLPPPNPLYLLPEPATLPQIAAGTDAPVATPLAEGVIAVSQRPLPRPKSIADMAAAAAAGKPSKGLDLAAIGPDDAVEPPPKPKKKTRADKAREKEAASKKGSVCGVAAIKGEEIAPIRSKVKGCGLADGVRVTSVSGVKLSQSATIDCATAKALNTWVKDVLQPAYGGDVVELRVAAHYICRSRNNKKGAKISEHGRGKAIDIAGFVLDSGKVVMVLGGYNKTLRRVHQAACGIFNTTLGPGSDGYHEDHLHFDTAGGRGPYCR